MNNKSDICDVGKILPQAKRINPGIGGWNEILVAHIQEAKNQSDEIDEIGDLPKERLFERNSNVSLD